MNGFQNRKGQDLQKPFPGCMGRMINIFDLSTGMPRNKLLTDKPHQHVSPIHGSRPDMKNAKDNFGAQKEDKTIMNHLRKSSSKSSGTPMKMLIAQEMSREPHSKQKPSNVVAKLMGLDSLPVQQSEGYSHKSQSGEFRGYWPQEDGYHHNTRQFDAKSCVHNSEYKDVHEIWQQPPWNTHIKDKPPEYRRHDENPIEKRMALVHQKFTEAKRLATDKKLLQSREFQEALEVLSSNRDLFLKFLEEQNAPFSKRPPELQPCPTAIRTRRITLLKPSRTMESKGEAQERRPPHLTDKGIGRDIGMNRWSSRSSNSFHLEEESITQPTRIVVLKPNPGMCHEMKSGVASPVALPEPLEGRECYGSLEPDEAREPREIAKKITRQMQEHMSSSRKVEISPSSALSNGYVADESSFNRSENDYVKEDCNNTSYSEYVSSNSRHSWDHGFRLGSPISLSSFSRASYSSEPSVIKEAKKRLSERLAMVSSKGTSQEQSEVQRSSSTLGEMLSIADVKKEGAENLPISSRRSYEGGRDQKASPTCLSIGGMREGCSESSPRNLTRSKSLPVSCSVCENIGLMEEVSGSMISKAIVPKEVVAKSKSGKSSFKGKVSSLFLSRIKKAGREKAIPSCFVGFDHSEASGKRNDAASESFQHCHSDESISINSEGRTGKVSSSTTSFNGLNLSASIPKASLSFEKSGICENSRENQDQPSPISVLEAPFEDDASNSICQPSPSLISAHPQALSRSPPIGSISRTLTRENPRETTLQNSVKLSRVLSKECEKQERVLLVQKLLSYANLLDNAECGTVLARWHSLDSPLDPILLDEFLDRKEEEEAKCRDRRSNQRLVFDCVNAALLSGGQATLLGSYPWATAYGWASMDRQTCTPVAEEVSRLVNDWFSCEERQVSGEVENRNQVVDKLVKGEIAGKGWTESMCLEVDEFSREIGGKVLEELIEDALADLTDECL